MLQQKLRLYTKCDELDTSWRGYTIFHQVEVNRFHRLIYLWNIVLRAFIQKLLPSPTHCASSRQHRRHTLLKSPHIIASKLALFYTRGHDNRRIWLIKRRDCVLFVHIYTHIYYMLSGSEFEFSAMELSRVPSPQTAYTMCNPYTKHVA